jgi:hypothetical protein
MIDGSSPGKGWEFFSSPQCRDRLWRPPSFLPNRYQGALSLGGRGGRGIHLVPRSRMHGVIHPLPQYVSMVWCSVKAQGRLYFYNERGTKYLKTSQVAALRSRNYKQTNRMESSWVSTLHCPTEEESKMKVEKKRKIFWEGKSLFHSFLFRAFSFIVICWYS